VKAWGESPVIASAQVALEVGDALSHPPP
jgi:hypothetical protein